MEQRNAVPQGTARPRPPRTAEERQRDRRLALSLLTRLAAAAAALTVLLGVVLLVTQAEGQDMFPAVKDGDLLIAYRLQRHKTNFAKVANLCPAGEIGTSPIGGTSPRWRTTNI